MPQCQGYKKNGEPCTMHVKDMYCYHHKKYDLVGPGKKKAQKPTTKKTSTKKTSAKKASVIIVFSGKLSKPRKQFKEMVESLDGKVNTSVSKNTDVIVVGSSAGAKLEKAKELKIPIWDEKTFMIHFERGRL